MSDILYEQQGTTGIITLNRPEVRNALTFGMYEELARICRETKAGGTVTSLIIRGGGDRAFAAGTDMTQFHAFSTNEDALAYEAKVDKVLGDIEKCEVPTIAAITGACTGGGAAIAAACDIRIADTRLKFGFPIAKTLGNCLSIANLNRLSVLMGAGRLRETILTARLIGSEEALNCGLISEILETAEAVHQRAQELASLLATHAPLTMQATKEALRRLRSEGPGADGSDLIIKTYMSEDFKEGLTAFLNKRPPEWKGK